MSTPSFRALSLLVLAASAASAVASDVRVGGARTFGLAGAGIALPLDVYETHTLNPALLGFAGTKLRFGVPYLGYHTDRISLGGVSDLIGDLGNGGVSDDATVKLARKYGNETKEFGVNGGLGISYGNFALSGRTEAVVRSVPNAQLKAFLATGDDNYLDAPIDSRLDAYGLGYYETDASYGHAFSLSRGDRLSFGATVRAVSGFYAHKVADADAIRNGTGVRNGTEIADWDDVIERSSLGVDFGAVGSLRAMPDAYFGMSARNLVEPDLAFVRTMPDTDEPLRRDLRPFRREIGLGAALVKSKYLAAFDLVDLGGHAGHAGFRLGGEYSFNKFFAVRGGYDSRSKFVVGISLGGINAAIAADGTTSLVSTIRF